MAISSASPSFTAASIRASFISRLAVLLFMAFSTEASFCSTDPSSDSRAFWIKACCCAALANPAATAASIRPSLVSRTVVWLLTAASTAASFCAIVPEIEEMACRSNSCAAWSSAKPLATAASISCSFSTSDRFVLLTASMMLL